MASSPPPGLAARPEEDSKSIGAEEREARALGEMNIASATETGSNQLDDVDNPDERVPPADIAREPPSHTRDQTSGQDDTHDRPPTVGASRGRGLCSAGAPEVGLGSDHVPHSGTAHKEGSAREQAETLLYGQQQQQPNDIPDDRRGLNTVVDDMERASKPLLDEKMIDRAESDRRGVDDEMRPMRSELSTGDYRSEQYRATGNGSIDGVGEIKEHSGDFQTQTGTSGTDDRHTFDRSKSVRPDDDQVVDAREGADEIPGVDDLPFFANDQSKALNDEIKVRRRVKMTGQVICSSGISFFVLSPMRAWIEQRLTL